MHLPACFDAALAKPPTFEKSAYALFIPTIVVRRVAWKLILSLMGSVCRIIFYIHQRTDETDDPRKNYEVKFQTTTQNYHQSIQGHTEYITSIDKAYVMFKTQRSETTWNEIHHVDVTFYIFSFFITTRPNQSIPPPSLSLSLLLLLVLSPIYAHTKWKEYKYLLSTCTTSEPSQKATVIRKYLVSFCWKIGLGFGNGWMDGLMEFTFRRDIDPIKNS